MDDTCIRVAIGATCLTLILSQFPLSHLFIALTNYTVVVVGQQEALEGRYLTPGWLIKKIREVPKKHQQNAVMIGLLLGGSSVLPRGWLLSSILAGLVGYYTPQVIDL